MKKLLLIFFILSSFNSKGAIYQISVWNGYYQFLPPNNITIQLGDTIQWIPLDPPTMYHTITSDNIPVGAAPFNQSWQMPADTFFQYIPQVAGLYQYVCTPHISFGMIGEFTVTNGSNTQTYVPDDNFEAYLEANGMGNGMPNDDYVTTANINTVTSLNVGGNWIVDLTGIEDFTAITYLVCAGNQLTSLDVTNNTALTELFCQQNQLTSLDVSSNTALNFLECNENQLNSLDVSNNIALYGFYCDNNQLTSLDLRNGNNQGLGTFHCYNNPNLYCINVDDASWSAINMWTNDFQLDSQQYYSNNCSGTTSIKEYTTNKELLKVTDLLGRKTQGNKNQPLFYIYNDGTIEKRINIE